MLIEKPKIFTKLEDAPKNAEKIDAFTSGLKELFLVEHPHLKSQKEVFEKEFSAFKKNHSIKDIWIYFPWSNKLVHSLPEELYFKLRTNRNRDVITEEEQKKYRALKVGIAGLSVGSSVLHALVMSGGPKIIKIADFDVLEITNLNRIRGGLPDVGLNKTMIAARQVWELDPFAELSLWGDGLTTDNLKDFILGESKLDIFIDEMDSLDLKAAARIICKENRIPVLMATDNGDSVLLDIERFDLEPDRPIFHGVLKSTKNRFSKKMDFKRWLDTAIRIIGPKYMTERHQGSILEIGKNLCGAPQLGTTAAIAGSAVSFTVRRFANRQRVSSGRYTFGLEEKLISGYQGVNQKKSRSLKTKIFIKEFSHLVN